MKSGSSLSATFMRNVPEPVFMPVNSARVSGVTALCRHEVAEQQLRPDVGGDRAREDFLAAGQHDAGRHAVGGHDLLHLGAGAYLDAARFAAADAMARVMAPMPPMAWPQAPRLPFTSPKQWCSSTYAVPGVDGAA